MKAGIIMRTIPGFRWQSCETSRTSSVFIYLSEKESSFCLFQASGGISTAHYEVEDLEFGVDLADISDHRSR